MLEQLKNLIELQLLENKKKQLSRSRDETPHQISELEKEFRLFERESLAKQDEFEQAQEMRKSLEHDLADLESKIARSKQHTNEVKTNKEYQALLKEIEDQTQETADKEDRLLETLENIESMKKEVKGLSSEVKKREKRFTKSKKELNSQSKQVASQITILETQQKEVYTRLEPELLKRCRSLMEKGGGVAVAPVQNGVCQVCYMSLPPQKFIELQRDEVILRCPSCYRFIYWADHPEYSLIEEDLKEI